ncbi:MAG: hypothetical protein GY719_24960, partial [bacterium]|nr:hypothetical protein [bacterium]
MPHTFDGGVARRRLPPRLRGQLRSHLESARGSAVRFAWHGRQRALDDGRFDSAYEHYLTRGATRGFDPHAAFSEGWYLDRNPDVAEAVAS